MSGLMSVSLAGMALFRLFSEAFEVKRLAGISSLRLEPAITSSLFRKLPCIHSLSTALPN